jgi:3' terminal RNA ribose 2'-O-methyltransferase Hen1
VLLTVTASFRPATDLGHLLHKNPARAKAFELAHGTAHVFYPEVSEERCTAALLLEIDPVGLVRGRRGKPAESFALGQYVNDRPYAASSLLSVAIGRVFRSALTGACKARPELATTPIPLTARLCVLPCRGGEELLRALFEPLGYAVSVTRHALDARFPEWGDSPYYTVELSAATTVRALLSHLYVLVPVLDNDKHYWVDDDEVKKLLRRGETWLAGHPAREQIVHRYLKHQKSLANAALAQLIEADPLDTADAEEREAAEEAEVERKLSLNEQRHNTVLSVLRASGARRVLDLGCSTGKFLQRLLGDRQFEEIVGLDVSHRCLEIASERLRLDRLPERQRRRVSLLHGSLIYRDQRLAGYDAAAVIEVIEHLDESRLAAFARVLFECARPRTVIVTTPNVEYNVRFENLAAGRLRHRDHRFEWTRQQFSAWANGLAERWGYTVRYLPVGPEDAEVGPPTQMAIFDTPTEQQVAAG